MPRTKPSVFVDTNVYSSLYYMGGDVRSLSRKLSTLDWWDTERLHFRLVTSSATETELRAGVYKGQSRACTEVRKAKYLSYDQEGTLIRSASYGL